MKILMLDMVEMTSIAILFHFASHTILMAMTLE